MVKTLVAARDMIKNELGNIKGNASMDDMFAMAKSDLWKKRALFELNKRIHLAGSFKKTPELIQKSISGKVLKEVTVHGSHGEYKTKRWFKITLNRKITKKQVQGYVNGKKSRKRFITSTSILKKSLISEI